MLLYVILLAGLVFVFMRLPTSFLPEEDQGILFTQIQLPTGATQERTLKVIEQVEDHFMNDEKDNVASVFAVAGFSFGGNGQNTGIAFVRLKDWSLRKDVGAESAGRGRSRHGQVLADQGCDGVYLRAACRAGTGQRHRFRHAAAGYRRCRPRRPDGGA